MPGREMIYRVSISTADAKRQAANLRATFEAELRTIKVGNLDTSSLKTAIDQAKQFAAELQRASSAGGNLGEVDTSGIQRGTAEAQRFRQELERATQVGIGEIDISSLQRANNEAQLLAQTLERAGRAASSIKVPSGGGGNEGEGLSGLGKGLTAAAAIAGLKQLAGELDQVSRRGAVFTQLKDVLNDYAASVGTNAEAMISAAKKASAGTISEYELILNANRSIQFQVATTAEQYAQLIELSTALGRAQGISDSDALGYLTTGLARESRLILDNLGLIVDIEGATSAYAASLGKASDELTTAERKAALLAEAFRQGEVAIKANRDAADSAATRYERFDANVQNLKDSFGELTASILSLPVGMAGNALQEMQEKYFEGGPSAETLLRRIDEMRAERDKIIAEGEGSFLGIPLGTIDKYNEKIDEAYRLLVQLRTAQGGVNFAAVTQEDFNQSTGSSKPVDMRSTSQRETDAAAEVAARVADFNNVLSQLDEAAANLSSVKFDGIEGIEDARNEVRELLLEFLTTGGATEEFASKLEQIGTSAAKTAAIGDLFSNLQDELGSTFLRTNEEAAGLIAQLTALNDSYLAGDSEEYRQTLAGIAFGLAEVAEAAQGEFNLALEQSSTALAGINQAILEGKPGLEGWRNDLISTREEIMQQGFATEEQANRIRAISQAYMEAGSGIQSYAGIVALVGESFFTTNERAAQIVETINNLAIAYANGEVSAASYRSSVEQLNSELEDLAVIDSSAATAAFGEIATAIQSLNTADMEIFPDLAGVRDELAGLYEEIGYGTSVTAEQAAQLDYLQSVAAAYADSTSDIAAVQDELGREFLESNGYAASLVEQMYMADGAYRAGIISSAQYAGILSALTGNLLTVAEGAGIATGSILALAAAQAGFASMPGFSTGFAQGSAGSAAAQAAEADRARENNRKEADRVAKEQARQAKQMAAYQDRAARSAAKHSESSAKKAGKELEKGAKKAAQELTSALRGVEGLFSASQVSEGDMKLGADYTDKADEYLRRLRDEVENGIDWKDVSIEEAKAAIEGIGVNAASTKEGILAQFEQLWNNQALFSDAANIDKFINDEAVQQALDLQEKSAQGEKNILEHFGVVVDEAVDAVISGGGGASYTPPEMPTFDPIEPANYIDVDPIKAGLQTGLDELSVNTGEAIKSSLANVKGEFFSGADWFGDTAATGAKATGPFGPKTKQEFLITATPEAAAFGPYLANAGANPTITVAPPPVTPTFDPATTQAELDKLELTFEITPTLAADSAEKMALALGDQLSKQSETLVSHGTGIGGNIKTGLVAALSLGKDDAVQIDVAEMIGGNLQAQIERFKGQGETIGDFLIEGITTAFANTDTAQVAQDGVGAIGLSASITGFTIAEGVRPADVGVLGVLNKFAIDETALRSANLTIPVGISLEQPTAEPGVNAADAPSVITPLIQSINTEVRTQTDAIKREGTVVGGIFMAGFAASFAATGAEGEASTGLVDPFLTQLNAQFSASQNMFYSSGLLPASNVKSGFLGYDFAGIDKGVLDGLTNGIRENAENYTQRGATIGSYVQRGLNDSFSSEVGLALAVAAGAAWGSAFQKGVMNQLGAGAGIVAAISDKVMADIAGELEQAP